MPTLFTSFRNEAPFILEWVAYHRSIGFDRIIVYSNDNTDGSDKILQALVAQGSIQHFVNLVPSGEAPQFAAARDAMNRNLFVDGDWIMWLDADEYLNVHIGEGKVTDLIERAADFQAVALNWRIFGDSGNAVWPGRQISACFTGCSTKKFIPNCHVKTIFRFGPHIAELDPHRPVLTPDYTPETHGPIANGMMREVARSFYHGRTRAGYPSYRIAARRQVYWHAQVNHYAVRTADVYARKKTRGRGAWNAAAAERHNDAFFNRFNRNERQDTTILRHLVAVDDAIAALRKNPAIDAAQTEIESEFVTGVERHDRK